MTRLITTGFETGDTVDAVASSGTIAINSASPGGRTGTYALRVNQTSHARLRTFTAISDIYIGFAVQVESNLSNRPLIKIRTAGGTIVATLRFDVGDRLEAMTGDSSASLATSALPVLVTNQWMSIEMRYSMLDAGGAFTVKIDGVQVINYSGDTKPGADTNFTTVELWGGTAAGAGGYNYFDDVVVNNTATAINATWPGIVKLSPIRPSAAGDSAQFTRGGTDSGNNWDQVEEVPASAAQYNYSTTVDHKDLFNAGTLTLPTGFVISNVVVVAQALLDSGTGNLALLIKAGGTESLGATQALSTTARNYEQAYNVDPSDSNVWTQADIDAIQIGYQCK